MLLDWEGEFACKVLVYGMRLEFKSGNLLWMNEVQMMLSVEGGCISRGSFQYYQIFGEF